MGYLCSSPSAQQSQTSHLQNRGVRARIYEHDHGVLIPQHLSKALENNYTIVHKALLLSCPIPTTANIPTFRTAIVAVEAALTCILGGFHNRQKTYGFEDLCPWAPESIDFNGLCSHNPLLEPVHGDLHLSPKQLHEMAEMTREKELAYGLEYARNLRANPTDYYLEGQRRNRRNQKPAMAAIHAERVASKAFYCKACKVSCRDKPTLTRHNATPRHAKKTTMGDSDYECSACNRSYRYKSDYTQHCATKTHIRRMAP